MTGGILAALLTGAAAAVGEEPCVSLYQAEHRCRAPENLGFAGSPAACGKLGAAKGNGVVEYFEAGWKLVRRVAAGKRWHPARDGLNGTAEYDDGNGTFSRRFDSTTFDQFLFTTGDMTKWLIMEKSAILRARARRDPLVRGPIVNSSNSSRPLPYGVMWIDIPDDVYNESIAVLDSSGVLTDILYAEGSLGGTSAAVLLPLHDGANVYIRNSTTVQGSAEYINTPPRCGACRNPSPQAGVDHALGWSLYSAHSCDYKVMPSTMVGMRCSPQSFAAVCHTDTYSECVSKVQAECDSDRACVGFAVKKTWFYMYVKYTGGLECVDTEKYDDPAWDLYVGLSRTPAVPSGTNFHTSAPGSFAPSESFGWCKQLTRKECRESVRFKCVWVLYKDPEHPWNVDLPPPECLPRDAVPVVFDNSTEVLYYVRSTSPMLPENRGWSKWLVTAALFAVLLAGIIFGFCIKRCIDKRRTMSAAVKDEVEGTDCEYTVFEEAAVQSITDQNRSPVRTDTPQETSRAN